ncbi:MAG: hypothetical protein ABL927_08310, partial [Bdellovibrionales bacterium]
MISKTFRFKILALLCYLLLPLPSIASVNNSENIYSIDDLKGATLYLFTSPECSYCVELEKHLKSTNQLDEIFVKSGLSTIPVKIKRFDPMKAPQDLAIMKTHGYE